MIKKEKRIFFSTQLKNIILPIQVIMNNFDTNKWLRLKECEKKRLYYHTHEKYRKNKNKNDNERTKK